MRGQFATYLLSTALALGVGSQLRADSAAIAADVAKNVQDLAGPTEAKINAAELRLLAGGAEQFPAIEAAATRPNLPPDVAVKLKKILTTMRPLQQARLKVAAARSAVADWQQKNLVAAYESGGKKDPKWDAAVKAAFMLYAQSGIASPSTQAAFDQAIKLGCNDPFVQTLAAACIDVAPAPDFSAAGDLFKASSPGIQSSTYPPDMKFLADVACAFHLVHYGESQVTLQGGGTLSPQQREAFMRATHPVTSPLAMSLLHKAVAIWPRIVKEAGIPPKLLETLAARYIEVVIYPEGDRKAAFDQIFPAMSAAFPADAATLRLEGHFEFMWAWDARGRGAARDVSRENLDLFAKRLAAAEPLLSKAADVDDSDSSAATTMIAVALGSRQGRAKIDQWFARAVKTNPDDTEAYRAELNSISPKWGGSADDIAQWMKKCITSSNWHAKLPLVATDGYLEMAAVSPDRGAAMWQNPKTWETINFVYSAWLNAYPDDTTAQSQLADLADRCGKADIAAKGPAKPGIPMHPNGQSEPVIIRVPIAPKQ